MTDILVLLGLIILNGLFAASEMALVSARSARLEAMARAGHRGARIALKFGAEPTMFLSTIQVGITTIAILSGAFGENAIAERLIEVFDSVPVLAEHSEVLATVVMVLLVTYCSVVLGEIVPKRLALLAPERFACQIAAPISVLTRLVHPAVTLLSASSSLILWLLGASRHRRAEVSEEEVHSLIAQGAASGVFKPVEQRRVGNVFLLDDIEVRGIMTPRTDVRWLDLNDPLEVNHALLREHRHQSYPVARGTLEEVVGMLDSKDYLARYLEGTPPPLESVMYPPLYVPETSSGIQLLETLRTKRRHIALVVDEYGGIKGMVSLTDLLEAIVGELPGMQETPADSSVQRADGSWSLDGALPIGQVEALLGDDLDLGAEQGGVHTLGGYVQYQLGRLPAIGDVFEASGLRFEVVDMDGHRVDRLIVSRIAPKGQPSA